MIEHAAHGGMSCDDRAPRPPPARSAATWTSYVESLVTNVAILALIPIALAMLGFWIVNLRSMWRFVFELAVSSSKFCLDVLEAWMTH